MEDQFRELLAHFANGVVVVTTQLDGVDHAMTANSFTSVSLDPPLVLFCVQRDSRFHDAIHASPRWVVNLLAAEQAPAARWFAERGRPLAGQLDLVDHTRDEHGVPVLDGCIGHLSCVTQSIYPGGDHCIVVGRVDDLALTDPQAAALVFLNHRLGPAR